MTCKMLQLCNKLRCKFLLHWAKGLYYEALGIRNLQKNDRIRNKLALFYCQLPFIGSEKHTSLLRSLYIIVQARGET